MPLNNRLAILPSGSFAAVVQRVEDRLTNPEHVAMIRLGDAAGIRLSDWPLGARSAGRNPLTEAVRTALARLPAPKADALIDQAEVALHGRVVSKAAAAPVVARPAVVKAKPAAAQSVRPTPVQPSAAQLSADRRAAADAVWARVRGRMAATSK